jgi:hypothetical protein
MRGSGEVGFTLLAMTLSLVTVFVSILFMGGLVERLFREFSITLAAAMLASLVVSLTWCQACAPAGSARRASAPRPFAPGQPAGVEAVRARLRPYAGWVLRHPRLVLVLSGIIALNWSLYSASRRASCLNRIRDSCRCFIRGDDGLLFAGHAAQASRPTGKPAAWTIRRCKTSLARRVGAPGPATHGSWSGSSRCKSAGFRPTRWSTGCAGKAPLIPGSTHATHGGPGYLTSPVVGVAAHTM